MSTKVRKWLGLPKCLSSIGIYVNRALSLSISSLVEEYKCPKARLDFDTQRVQQPLHKRCCANPSDREEMGPTCGSGRSKGLPSDTGTLWGKSSMAEGDWVGTNNTHMAKGYTK